MEEMTGLTAKNILKAMVMLLLGVTRMVQVTNVTFIDTTTGEPFIDPEWDEGRPYAIANFNLINAYGKAQAIEHFEGDKFQEACNQNESLRVRPELGKLLQEAMYCSVVGKSRTWTIKDEDSPQFGETVTAIKVHKAIPNEARVAKADAFADVFEAEAGAGAPDAVEQEQPRA